MRFYSAVRKSIKLVNYKKWVADLVPKTDFAKIIAVDVAIIGS